MSRPRNEIPSYRKHSSGSAVCTVRLSNGSRKDILLGVYATAASKREHARICGLVASNDGVFPSATIDMTVAEAILAYVTFSTHHYAGSEKSLANIKRALKTVRELYGPTSAVDFGPKALKLVQLKWVEQSITRKSINKMGGIVKRAFRWLASEELLPIEVFQRLQTVEGLRLGRTTAPDNPPVKPADPDDLDKALQRMPVMVAAVCQLQALSGARCGELLCMKVDDIDRSRNVWTFSPPTHKGRWRGKGREIRFGPAAQKILLPWLDKAGDGFVFSAVVAEAERNAVRSANRKTPRWKSHMTRNVKKRRKLTERKRPPRERYDTTAMRRAIARACDLAGVPRFSPHRLRHLAALRIREQFGLEYARAVLGHTVAAMSEVYSRDVDAKLAETVAAKIG